MHLWDYVILYKRICLHNDTPTKKSNMQITLPFPHLPLQQRKILQRQARKGNEYEQGGSE